MTPEQAALANAELQQVFEEHRRTELWRARAHSTQVRPVRAPPPLFGALALRAVRLYGMFVFVIGLLLCQVLVIPYLLRDAVRRPPARQRRA